MNIYSNLGSEFMVVPKGKASAFTPKANKMIFRYPSKEEEKTKEEKERAEKEKFEMM
ncbi:MAG: hypothetical protein ACOX3L_11870 [Lutisporaceae bacterium]